jgi:hypothetical protein
MARFPSLERGAGHYESFYLKASHPTEPVAVWIRHTVHKAPGETPVGAVWFSLFDARAEGPWAVKESGGALGLGDGAYVRVGEARIEPGRAVGRAAAGEREATWDLTFEDGEEALRHLPRDWMYRAPIPRTKLLTPHPRTTFSGRVTAGERELELDRWPGMVGHNWGAQHAERWIWMQGTGFQDQEEDWLDVVIGRIKVGPLTTPWIANGAVCIAGERHQLGGIERARSTEVHETPEGCDFVLPGRGVQAQGSVGTPSRKDLVGWVYADPDGSEHHVVNCSVADMRVVLSRSDGPDLSLFAPAGGVYEVGMRERDHGIAIQPYPDP